MQPTRMTRRDLWILLTFAGLMCGFAVWSGRVLTMHESRLAQAAREMAATGDWLIPQCGGRPWLERPPLPHWITVGLASLLGHCDSVWVVRLPAALVSVGCVWLIAWMATGWYGRVIGLLSGAILATMCQFLRYAWLVEEDIYLAGIVLATAACFVKREYFVPETVVESRSFWGNRHWSVWAFFLCLGATNLVKGLFFGAALILVAIAPCLLGQRSWSTLRRYVWAWGWLLSGVVGLGWIAAASWRYPDLAQLWIADVVTRTDGINRHDPAWYYLAALGWGLLPWTFAAIYGLWLTRREAWQSATSPARWLWCWACLPVLLLTIPQHKHHHYLVPCLAPWAILAAIGTQRAWVAFSAWPTWWKHPAWGTLAVGIPGGVALWLLRERLPSPTLVTLSLAIGLPVAIAALIAGCGARRPAWAAGLVFGTLAVGFGTGHWYAGKYVDLYRADTEFLLAARETVGDERPLYINGHGAILNMFRHLFYLGDNARMLHNLTFLRDAQITDREVFLIARLQEQQTLQEHFGPTEVVLESAYHEKKRPPESRWTLFRVTLRSGLQRYNNTVQYSAKQVMEREPGPYLGEPLPQVLSVARGETGTRIR